MFVCLQSADATHTFLNVFFIFYDITKILILFLVISSCTSDLARSDINSFIEVVLVIARSLRGC